MNKQIALILGLIKKIYKKNKRTSLFLKKEIATIKTGCDSYSCSTCSLGDFLKFLPQDTNCFELNQSRIFIFSVLIKWTQEKELKKHLSKGRY